MEHPDKFGYIGALSPAFALFDESVWSEYFEDKDFGGNYPYVYIYCGEGDSLEEFLMTGAEAMPDQLKAIGYPEEKITFTTYGDGLHNETYWRAVFPEFLKVFNYKLSAE